MEVNKNNSLKAFFEKIKAKGDSKEKVKKNSEKFAPANSLDALEGYGRAQIAVSKNLNFKGNQSSSNNDKTSNEVQNEESLSDDPYVLVPQKLDKALDYIDKIIDSNDERKGEIISMMRRELGYRPNNDLYHSESDLRKINNSYILNPEIDDGELLKLFIDTKMKDPYSSLWGTKEYYGFESRQIFDVLTKFDKNDTKIKKEGFEILTQAKDSKDNTPLNLSSNGIISILPEVNSENINCLEFLLNIRYKDEGNVDRWFFNDFEGYDILKAINSQNKDFAIRFLNNCQNDKGLRRSILHNLANILNFVDENNNKIVEELIDMKDDSGNSRFDYNDIKNLTNILVQDPKKKEFLNELICAREGKLSGFEITTLLDKVDSEQKHRFFEKILNAKDNEGKYRFNVSDISSLLNEIDSEEKKEFFEKIFEAKDDEDKYRFDSTGISSILNKIDSQEKKEFFEKILNTKDDKGKYRFDGAGVAFILRYVDSKERKEVLDLLLDAKDYDGKYRFNGSDIYLMFRRTDLGEKKELFEKLLNAKYNHGRYRFDSSHISSILNRIDSQEKKEFLNELICARESNLDGYEITELLDKVDSEQKHEIFEKILNAKDDEDKYRFNVSDISSVLNEIDSQEKKEFFEKLIVAKDDDGKYRFSGDVITKIMSVANSDNFALLNKLINCKDKDNKFAFEGDDISEIIENLLVHDFDEKYLDKLLSDIKTGELTGTYATLLISNQNNFTLKDIKTLERVLSKEFVRNLDSSSLVLAAQLKNLVHKNNINEIPLNKKKDTLRKLVSLNVDLFNCAENLKEHFPLIPANEEEYCSLLSSLAKSIGIETNEISKEQSDKLIDDVFKLSDTLSKLSDDDFNNLQIEQSYKTDDFIKDVYEITKELSQSERQKVYDYFGFELRRNETGIEAGDGHHYTILGYPVNLNNGKKLAQIKDKKTKEIVEKLRPYVIKYSENNPIKINNKELERQINDIVSVFPEIRTQIGRVQHKPHEFDLFKHSLKVMQKITQNPKFDSLNPSDKKVMLLSSMFHDITKVQGLKDVTHPFESSFDAYYILKKLDLTKDEEIKIYSLIKSHNWLGYVNSSKITDEKEAQKRLQSVAFDLQHGNLFEMSKMFTQADLSSIKEDNSFYDYFEEAFKNNSQKIDELVNELKKTQPLLPVTKIPKASRIKQAIEYVNDDGSTNLKGIYVDEKGLVIIKYNEVENETWEKIGFAPGSVSRGYETKDADGNDINTGNIKFFVHGLDMPFQLRRFDAFNLPDSDALLSVSYAERVESKFRFFRPHGVILDTDANYSYGGGFNDSGSGCGKNIDMFKDNYIFGGENEIDRKYVPELVKETLGMDDSEYLAFVEENKNKPFCEVTPKDKRDKLIEAFAKINSRTRDRGERSYNEMYISNPSVMAMFAYSWNGDKIDDVMEFVSHQKQFIKDYALDNDLALFVFGE